jgi:hypothetical protein
MFEDNERWITQEEVKQVSRSERNLRAGSRARARCPSTVTSVGDIHVLPDQAK